MWSLYQNLKLLDQNDMRGSKPTTTSCLLLDSSCTGSAAVIFALW